MVKSVLSLSFIVATRFFGLFIVLPVLSLYALNLKGSNEILVGLLVGVYAIMQMILQLPFGMLSDKIGRKNSLAIGLVIFIIGSFVCAWSDDIYYMIFGRFLQGCGAVGAVATAMISDFTKEEERGKAMAMMGAMIGLAFASSMVLSPFLSAKFGLSSLFNLSAVLTLICVILLYTAVPKEVHIRTFEEKAPLFVLLGDKNLTLMNLTNFLQKMFMTMAFFAIPIVLVKEMGYPQEGLWKVYSVAMVFGFLAMGFAGAIGERRGLSKQILLAGILFFVVSYFVFAISETKFFFIVGVVIFFIGFNMHEPIMQSLASKFAKADQKGSVLGIFNSAGFFGSFMGGVLGGWLMSEFGIHILAYIIAVVGIFWFLLLLKLSDPNRFKNLYFDRSDKLNIANIHKLQGIIEYYEKDENFIIKFDPKIISEESVKSSIF